MLHDYFEVMYSPLIGPTSVFLARNLARHIAAAGGPVTVCPIELAREVGLRASHNEPIGKGSHLAKSLDRLGHHRLVKHLGPDTLGVVVEAPALNGSALARLPISTRHEHDRLVAALTNQ